MQMSWIGKERNESGQLLILLGMISTYIIGGFLALIWWVAHVTGDDSLLFMGWIAFAASVLGGLSSIAGLLMIRRS
jgi:hypothetical protein